MLPVRAVLNTTKASFAMEGMHATEDDEKNIIDVLTEKRCLADVMKEIRLKYLSQKKWQTDERDYECKDSRDIKYCYPGTSVLVNKFDIRNGQQLNMLEREISIVKAAVLANGITGSFDFAHLMDIHRFLFEDLYDWAGQIRTVDIAKKNIFCLVQFIEPQFLELYRKMRQDNFLKDESDIEYVSSKISYYLSEINVIHPFREGNGRTQRIFCQQLCINTGRFYLDFAMAKEGEMLEASMDSFMCNYEKMEMLMRRCIKERW